MRLTLTLYKEPLRWLLKNKWKQKGFLVDYPPCIPYPVVARGVEVVDAKEMYGKEEEPGPPQDCVTPDHPDFDPPTLPQDHPDYHEEPIYSFSHTTKLHEGEQQACILTKTQPFYQLPPGVADLVGKYSIQDQDLLAQRYIMQANVWDPTKDRLPKRFNPELPGWNFKREFGIPEFKSTDILHRNLIRLCQTLGGVYPDLLLSRSVTQTPYIRSNYFYHDLSVQIEANNQCLIDCLRPLPAFASHDVIDESAAHQVPDIYPIAPTIDLKHEHIYQMVDHSGWKPERRQHYPHTFFINHSDSWNTSQQNAKILMYMFAYTTVSARQTYGADVTLLPEPISVQCISSNGNMFHFACFQLNTLDMSHANGVKNLVWFDNDNLMYVKDEPKRAMLRNMLYVDYDPDVLRKLIAMYLYGADLSLQSWPNVDDTVDQAQAAERL